MAASLFRAAGDFATLVELLGSAPESAIPRPGALRQQLLGLLEGFARAASAAGAAAADVEDARFALVAFADEVISRSHWSGRDEWQREPLQMQLYQTHNAGKEFFERLARLRPEARAREVFFLALALGFQGQYAGHEADLGALVSHQYSMLRATGRALELGRERTLTPSAYRLDVDLARGRRGGVLRGLAVMAGTAVAAWVGLWALLQLFAADLPIGGGG
jgi:type VI secretion system protein ImpK